MLFVCTANISRSPYAEHRAAQQLAGTPSAAAVSATEMVASAGMPGFPGRGMDPAMAAELGGRGGKSAGHISRSLSRDILIAADLVLTFEFAQRMRIIDEWPDQAIKVFGLRQFVEALGRVESSAGGLRLLDQVYRAAPPDGMHRDVADPYRRGAAAARACADEIDGVLTVILPALFAPGSR